MYRCRRLRVRAAAARQALDAVLVTYYEASSAVIDQVLFAQTLSDARDAWTVNAEHARDMFVSDPESVSSASALQCQKPAAESLLDRVECIANHAL